MNVRLDGKKETLLGPNTVTNLETQVQCRLGGQLRDFHVVLQGTGLILRGNAQTYHVKQLAQHEIMQATTLPIVANEIEVARPPSRQHSNSVGA